MSDSVLNRIVSNDTKNQKEQAHQTNLLTDILSVQEDILQIAKGEAKQAARDRQKNKAINKYAWKEQQNTNSKDKLKNNDGKNNEIVTERQETRQMKT